MSKLDRTLVTHVSEKNWDDFTGLLYMEQLDNPALTSSSFLLNIVKTHIESRRRECELLNIALKGNHEN